MRAAWFVHLILVAVGVYALADGLRIGGSSGLFATVLGPLLVAIAILSLVRARRTAGETAAAPDRDTAVAVQPTFGRGAVQAAGLALLALFITAMGWVGIFTAALVFTPILALVGGERRRARLVAVTVVFVGGLYVVFAGLLRLPLPPDLLFG